MDSEAWDERYAETALVWSAEPNQFVAAECADLAPGRAVDLAAGEGRNAIWLAGRGWDVTAVDFSQVALDKGRRLAGATAAAVAGSVDWVHADATTWTGAGYDLAVVAYLQLPADERRAAARRAVESLASGGTLVWVAHDATNLTEGSGGPQDPSVLMSADDVVADVQDLGVDVRRAERVARVVPPSGEHRGEPDRTAWDCLVRLVRA
jgi:SAM-dependent methyltransferase